MPPSGATGDAPTERAAGHTTKGRVSAGKGLPRKARKPASLPKSDGDAGVQAYIAMGAAGWHICFDVLDRLLAGHPIGRMVGPNAMKVGGWKRLHAEYTKQFGAESPSRPSNAPKQ